MPFLVSLANGIQHLNESLKDSDPELYDIIEKEKRRQRESIVLIPSEVNCFLYQLLPSKNFTSKAVMDALGSVMQNKYSEGYPGAR